MILVLDAVRVSGHFDALRSVLFDAAGEGSKVNSIGSQRVAETLYIQDTN